MTTSLKMVKAQAIDGGVQLAVELLADPAAGLQLPHPHVAAEALARAVDALLTAIVHIDDAGQLAGILAANEATETD